MDTEIKFRTTRRYNWHPAGIECIEVIEEFDLLLGTAIKYIWRAADPDCDPEERLNSLQKAEQYLLRKIVKTAQALPEPEENEHDDGACKADAATIRVDGD